MSPEELRRAVTEPACKVGRPLNDTTVDLLLAQAQGSDGALPLLSYALGRIFEGMLAGRAPEITLREIGGVGGALAGRAQEVYEALSERQQRIARRALLRLVKLGEGTRDTRRRVAIKELCGRGETEGEVLAVLRAFAADDTRLLILSGDAAAPLAEVAHEALFDHWKELRRWIDEGRAARRFHNRIAEAARLWDEDKRRTGRLWRPPDLDLLSKFAQEHPEDLNEQQHAFWQAGLGAQRNERRLRWTIVAALLGLLGTAAAIYITQQRRNVRQAEERAAERAKYANDMEQSKREVQKQLMRSYVEQGRPSSTTTPSRRCRGYIAL